MVPLPGEPAVADRRFTLCYECRVSRSSPQCIVKWDWASAVNKQSAMMAQQHHNGKWVQMSPEIIRAVAAVQGGKCAVSGIPLLLPDIVSTRSTMDRYVLDNDLPAKDRARVPVLTRVSKRDPEWAPGNVMLVASALAQAVQSTDSFEDLVALLHQCHTPVVPTRESVIKVVKKYAYERNTEWGRKCHDHYSNKVITTIKVKETK